MIIVGGIYHELCRDPVHEDLFGSGLRASYALSKTTAPPTLCSVATAEEADLVKGIGIMLDHVERTRPIRFWYDTPISSPIHDYNSRNSWTISLATEADMALVFGMLEAKPTVRAARLVIDPQSPNTTDLREHFDWNAERLAIVGNQREILGLAGSTSRPVSEAAERVRELYSAELVIAKCGPLGAVLVDDSGLSIVNPYPTAVVWPIGSGDVFSALFAWYWGDQEEEPLEAARRASMGTATWCSKGALQVVTERGEVIAPQSVSINEQATLRDVRIYLAGPFFNYGERWLVNLVRDSLINLGIGVFSPLHDVGIGPPDKVAPADIRGLEDCHAVLALLDGVDSGTLFEVGYAKAKNIPVVGFAEQPRNPNLTMLLGTEVPVYSDLAQAVYQAAWSGLT